MALPRAALLMSAVDPNDPAAVDTWTDFARTRMLRVRNAGRGRQYEIGQSVAGRMETDLLNIDEYLNPANASSPLLSTAKLMRRVRWMGVLPADGVGNLVNQGNIKADPSFESYAVATTVSWIYWWGVQPTIVSAPVHSGTRSAQQAITGGAGIQGMVVEFRFIPGDVYMASVWVNQSAANTTELSINGKLVTPMASTAATGWVKLIGTFTADQPTLQVCVVDRSPTLSGTLTIDEIQVEQAPAPLNANPYFEPPLNATSWTPVNGATIVASTAQSHEGTASLLITPDGVTAVPQAQSEEIPVAGSTPHILAGWLRSASSGTRTLNIFWFDNTHTFTSSSAISQALSPGVWTQYGPTTFTSPAGAAYARVVTNDPGTPIAGNSWRIDQATLTTASAFTTSGPRIRGLWGGHVEKLPITWEPGSNGYTGTAKLSAVGPLAAIAQTGVKTDYAASVAAKKPDLSWALSDGSTATAWAETSGGNGPPLTRLDNVGTNNAVGFPTFSAGVATNIPGDPGGTGVSINYNPGANAAIPTTILQAGMAGTAKLSGMGAAAAPFGMSMAAWVSWTALPTNGGGVFLLINSDAFVNQFYIDWVGPASNLLRAQLASNNQTVACTASAASYSDGKPHLLVITVNWGVSTVDLRFYIDGALVGSSLGASTAGFAAPFLFSQIQVGGFISPNTPGSFNQPGLPGGIYSQVELWNRQLSAQDVTDLYNAGKGYPGDTPGQRLNRLFGLYYVGPTVVDNGRTLLGVSGATDGTKLGQLTQRIVDSEAGNLFENRDAALEFDGRDTRFLATAPWAVFGENVAGGEIPYRDTPVFGYDTVQLSNQATVSQPGGTKANTSDPASIKSYYQRSITVNTDAQSGLVAIDHANWLTATRKQPKQRVERITLDPGANPSIQAAVFDLEIGLRYTLKRAARSGNGGAGVTMTGDFFLENINHRDFDPEKGTWLVDLILSPAPLQPWILGDPTYGQLGVTTVLGF